MRKLLGLVVLASLSHNALACLEVTSGYRRLDQITIQPDQVQFVTNESGSRTLARLNGAYALNRYSYYAQCTSWWGKTSANDVAVNQKAALTALDARPTDTWAHVNPTRAFTDHKVLLAEGGQPTAANALAQCQEVQEQARRTAKDLIILVNAGSLDLPACALAP